MTGQWERPWLEIPVPDYLPPYDPENWNNPKTKEDNPDLDENERVVIIDL